MVQISNSVDTASIVSQLMAVERIPQDQLKQRVTALQTKQSAWSQIGAQVSALHAASDALAPVGSLAKLMAATSSNDAAVGVRLTGTASPSSSTIDVVNLATTHSVVSTDTFSDPTAADGGRNLTVNVGGTPTTFTSTNGTIGGLVDAVNAGNAGVKAKMLQTSPNTYQMVLTATTSGAAAAFTATGTGWTELKTMTAGADATLKVDGVTVKRSSNVISDLMNGVELTLKQPTTSSTAVNVTRDDNAIVTKVKALVDAANSTINSIASLTKSATDAASRGVLAGDSSASSLADSIRSTIAAGVTGTDGVLRSASKLGVSLNKDGTIAFDETALRTSLTDDPAGVAAMLGRGGSSNVPGVAVASVLSSSTPGTHAIQITQTASASALVGVPVPPPPAGSTINMTVNTPNGSVLVTFTAGSSYSATAASLSLALTRAGLTMEAASDGTSFNLAEKRLGSRNTFSVTGGGALGLSGSATPGTDVMANIDGTPVTGQGSSIVNNGTVLTLGVTASQLASGGGTVSGTYQVSDGLAGAFSRVGGTISSGVVPTATSSLDSQVKDLQDRISRYDSSLALKQTALNAKFASMDTLLTKMQGTMSTLQNFALHM